MKRFIFVLLAVLTLTTVCTPCVCAYDIASGAGGGVRYDGAGVRAPGADI